MLLAAKVFRSTNFRCARTGTTAGFTAGFCKTVND